MPPRCPSCRESRWVYYQPLPLLSWVMSLTGRKRYECLSCGWRGWRSPHQVDTLLKRGLATIAAERLKDAHRLVQGSAQLLKRRAREIARRWKQMRPQSFRRPPVPAIVVLVLGCALPSMFMLGGRHLVSVDQGRYESASATEPAPLVPVDPAPAPPAAHKQPQLVPAVQKASDAAPPPPQPVASPSEESVPRTRTGPTTGQADRDRTTRAARAAQSVSSPAPARARYLGSLVIDSDPPGAYVSVGGRPVGSTPIALEDLPAGSCVIRVEADGYELWSTAARVVANQRTRVTAILQRGSER